MSVLKPVHPRRTLCRSVFSASVLLAVWIAGCVPEDHAGGNEGGNAKDNGGASAAVPYQLQLKPLAAEDFPGLHSGIYATYEDKLVLMGGRINGLHGFPGQDRATSNPSFPRDKSNDHAFLIELQTGRVLAKASVTNLPAMVAQQLTSTNSQFAVDEDDNLYVAGGYGYSRNGDGMETLQQAMAVSLAKLVEAIGNDALNEDFAAGSVYVGSHPALAITGGELESSVPLGGTSFLLIFGHQFDGVYSTGGGNAVQKYSESVRQFNFSMGESGQASGKPVGELNVELVDIVPPISRTRPVEETEPYHRRDLTILPLLSPQGEPLIAALGGVFVPGRIEGFLNPVWITAEKNDSELNVKLEVDDTVTQLMGQYRAANVPVHSKEQGVTYSTVFAGISQYYWKDGKLHRDTTNFNVVPPIDGMPFINTVSTLRITTAGSGQYLHNDERFPPQGMEPKCGTAARPAPYLGAETIFVPVGDAVDGLGVIQLDGIREPTVVGYLVGGIASLAPYPDPTGTCASATYYQVTLVPNQATPTTLLSL